jgi:hypothetical protein
LSFANIPFTLFLDFGAEIWPQPQAALWGHNDILFVYLFWKLQKWQPF